ncbi:MAG: signal peptidase I [Bacilli bacterium]
MDFRDVQEFFRDTFKYLIVIVIVLLIALYVVSFQQIVGNSMNNNYYNNDVVILNKLQYKFFDVKRSDIVSFNYDDTKYLIKRVVGLPGEFIEFKDNTLYINNKAYKENYITEFITKDFSLKDLGYDKIPENMYLVLGDNREDSLDSRKIGLIKEKDLIGKCIMRIWPLNKFKVM